MANLRITKEFRFEGAHALLDYDGKCRHIHGHSYRLMITVEGVPSLREGDPKIGMIMDFGDLKDVVETHIVKHFDHALLLRRNAPLAEEISGAYQNVLLLDFQPTCEQLTLHFADILKKIITLPNSLYSVRLYETPTSWCEWTK
ncbi:MAG: 6-carboxytetrahydropterin synthase [Bacteroidales bacterium]|nr:6-carboxytetrahydropterin synthase [Bacteroidales bacterium]MDD4827245.1 6-carboxytetrahydropterin synthase [Bacteroidales bacterium]HNY23699.1 6-carboxytetrahydropterin synthase [Bacteroidales bacterium]